MTSVKKGTVLALSGLAAGVVNGLLGAGSGVIIVFALQAVLGASLHDSRDIFANATAIILPISLFSSVTYFLSGELPATQLSRYMIPGVIGGLIGAFLLGKLPEKVVKCIFALLVLVSGLIMLIR